MCVKSGLGSWFLGMCNPLPAFANAQAGRHQRRQWIPRRRVSWHLSIEFVAFGLSSPISVFVILAAFLWWWPRCPVAAGHATGRYGGHGHRSMTSRKAGAGPAEMPQHTPPYSTAPSPARHATCFWSSFPPPRLLVPTALCICCGGHGRLCRLSFFASLLFRCFTGGAWGGAYSDVAGWRAMPASSAHLHLC